MSAQRLMCVWQTVYAMDTSRKVPLKEYLLKVTSSFSQNQMVHFSNLDFNETFPEETVDFDKFAKFAKSKLAFSRGTYHIVEDAIESMCWDRSRAFYDIDKYKIGEEDCRKMWEIFNRLCQPRSFPPVIEREEAYWLGEKLCSQLGQHWTYKDVPSYMSYVEFMKLNSEKCFSKAAPASFGKAIDDLHAWLVKEVAMTGWLFKRTRKQANWTSWLKRWFVLTPGQLCYYEGPRLKDKKGAVSLTSHSKLEELPTFKSLARRFPNRFRITNSPYLEIDLSVSDAHERNAWMDAILEIIAASKAGVTPVQAILNERRKQKHAGMDCTIDEATAKLRSVRLQSFNTKSNDTYAEEVVVKRRSKKRPSFPQLLPLKVDDDTINIQIGKIQDVFRKVDKKGSGAIDEEHFCMFIRSLGLKISDEEINNIFCNIEVGRDGVITIDEFINFFMTNVLDERGGRCSKTDARLRAAFLRADRDGTGTVDFREFVEYLWEKRRSTRLSRMMTVFDAMDDGKGEVSFEQFKAFFKSQRTSLISDLGSDDDDKPCSPTLEDHLRSMYNEADVERMASFLRQRWNVFASFKRAGESGNIVMHGGHGMVADVLPGNYNLVDLACFNDLPPITPRHVVVKNFIWISSNPGCHGQAIFPLEYDGIVPTDIATTEHLSYYGCSLADSTQVQVSLMYRHGIQDFTYMNQYLQDYVETANGGAGIETHDFSHLDCPLESDSGHFILGKMVGDDLHLTAFYVPVRHSLYVPGRTIHSNDYLKGTWRTMLSDESEIDHVHLLRPRKKDPDKLDHFTFKFN